MKKLIIVLFLFLLFSCTNDNVDINLKPTDSKSARNIAYTIAKFSECKNIEGFDIPYGIFHCRKELNEKNNNGETKYAEYSISVYYDESIMTKNLEKLIDSRVVFKKGKYFTIERLYTYEQFPTVDQKPIGMNPNREINVDDYINFPGEIILPKN